jgi:translation elongation factor EF-4
LAFANNLAIVPVLNKIDMKNANPEAVKEQLLNLFEIDPSDVILASAKNGIGISEIFEVSQ